MAVASAPTRDRPSRWRADDLLAEPADVQRGLEEVVDGGEALVLAGICQVLVDAVEHLLGGGEVAGGLQHEGAVGAGVDHVELAVVADVVEPGVGARVGHEDQGFVESQCEAIGHGKLLVRRDGRVEPGGS